MERDQVLFRLFGKYCPEGTILYTEGTPGLEAYLVQSGALRLVAAGAPPRELGPGALLGEEAFFEPAPRAARAEARADTRLLLVGERTLDAIARNGPEALGQVLAGLVAGAAAARRDLEAWALERALRRAEPLLREAATRPVGRAEFLEQAGGHDARRLLEELERQGAVLVAGEAVRVPDPAALGRAAGRIAAGAGGGP